MKLRFTCRWALPAMILLLARFAAAADPLVQVKESFDQDPGWQAINNRIVAENPPLINQDFGWTPGDDGQGAIGGEIWAGVVPASYGMPIGPFDLTQELSASGKIAVMEVVSSASTYFGFYNAERQGWRPWSSMTLQFTPAKPKKMRAELKFDGPVVIPYFCVIPASWSGDGVSSDELQIPADGKPHAWSFHYEPEAKMPDGTVRCRVTLQVEGVEPYVGLSEKPDLRKHPALMNRFGLVNCQNYGQFSKVYFSDLTVNGHKIDLSKDPGWDGRGNRSQFPAWSFRGRHDYGFMETNWAGSAPGEVGGRFWGTEFDEPLFGYYADDVGSLTLDDPLSFSGSVCYVDSQVDSGMMLGWFNSRTILEEKTRSAPNRWPPASMGIHLEGPGSLGTQMIPYCSVTPELSVAMPTATDVPFHAPIFQSDRVRRKISFNYDPQANGGVGRFTLALDGKEYAMDLTAEQRKAGVTFDRFGLMNLRGGGKCVVIYFDDLTYTARRPADHQPLRRKQEFVKTMYR